MSQRYLKVENGQHKKDNASARKEDRHVHDAVASADHHGQRDERSESMVCTQHQKQKCHPRLYRIRGRTWCGLIEFGLLITKYWVRQQELPERSGIFICYAKIAIISCNISVRTQGYFFLNKFFFAHESIKNWPQLQHTYGLTAQIGPRMKIHIGNVSQDTSVL